MLRYFECVLRNMAEKKRNGQVVAQLLRSECLQVNFFILLASYYLYI